jgi:hypothetical protein
MGTNGYVNVVLIDNGGASIVVPSTNVQVVIGTSQSGTVNQVVSTRSPQTLFSTFGYGPLTEASALSALAGGTILAIRATSASAGTVTAVTKTGTGTSVVTVTGTPFDTYFVEFLVISGGTIGTGPITFQISLDAGRTFSPTISLGTATTYVIPGTGLTLNFGAGTLVTGDIDTFSTCEPTWNDAGIQAAINAFSATQYAVQGIGSMHIPGGSASPDHGAAGSDATTIGGYLTALAAAVQPQYTDVLLSARDAHVPIAWGGAGETEAAWMAAIELDYSAVAQTRVSVGAAYWNMPSAYANPLGMVPRFRRSVSFALAQRTILLSGPQRSWGRVRDGNLAPIVINPITDPVDGFIYHNEAINPGLNANRFATTTTRAFLQGIYNLQANNMAATGSQISSRPLIAVWNVAATILVQTGQQEINDNVRILPNGTLDPRDLNSLQALLLAAINANMTSQQMISSATVTIDPNQNVQTSGVIAVTATLTQRLIVLQVNINLQYSNPLQAGQAPTS